MNKRKQARKEVWTLLKALVYKVVTDVLDGDVNFINIEKVAVY